VEVIPQSSTIGAEVRGLDLTDKLSDALIEQLNGVFLYYHGHRRVMHRIIVEGERPA